MSITGQEESVPRPINRRVLDSELMALEHKLLHLSQEIPGMIRSIADIRRRLEIPPQTEMVLDDPAPEVGDDDA